MLPFAEWSDYDKGSRDFLLNASRELELPTIDLLPVSERLIAAGVDPKERPQDFWHPNEAFGKEAAKYILERVPWLAAAKNDRQIGP